MDLDLKWLQGCKISSTSHSPRGLVAVVEVVADAAAVDNPRARGELTVVIVPVAGGSGGKECRQGVGAAAKNPNPNPLYNP